MKKRRVCLLLLTDILLLVALYCIICIWGYGEVKANPIALIQRKYEKSNTYNIKQLLDNHNIENAIVLEDGSFYTDDASMIVRLPNSDFSVRSIELIVKDFVNPRGMENIAVNTHVFYNQGAQEANKRMLLKIGRMSFDLPDNTGESCIISPSNIEKVSIGFGQIVVNNYCNGYLEQLTGGLAFILCVNVFIILSFLTERRSLCFTEIKVNKRIFGWGGIIAAIILLGLYLSSYLKLPHIIHPEVYGDFERYANEIPGEFFRNLIPKVFDNTMIELGLYRPRAMAFLWQYVDTNLMIKINELWPAFGIKMPLTLTTIVFLLFMGKSIYKNLFPDIRAEWGMVFGVVLLFIPNILTGTFFFLRSAKIIAPIVVVAILNYGIGYLGEAFEFNKYKSQWKRNVGSVLVLLLLCTLDEQVISACVFLVVLSLIYVFFERHIQWVTINFSLSLILYAVYHKWWGRLLFEYFTPVALKEHIHNISMIFTDFQFLFLKQALDVDAYILKETFNNNILLGIILGIFVVFWLYIKNWKEKVVSLGLLFFSYGLTIVLLIGLPVLYELKDFQLSIYFITPILVFIYATLYTISKSELISSIKVGGVGIGKHLILLTICICLVSNVVKLEECHLRHLGINGGSVQFREKKVDLEYFNNFYDSVIVTREQYDDYMEDER